MTAATPEPSVPQTRIGDAERTSAMEALGEHMRAGRLDPHEYDDRVLAVNAARTSAELEPLFADLPAPHPAGATVAPVVSRPVQAVADHDDNGALFGRLGTTLVAASPFIALILFFVTDQWLWFLLVPLVGAIVYGGGHSGGRDRDERHRVRDERRNR